MYLPGVFAPQPSVLNGKARPKLIMLSFTPCHALLRCAVLVQGAGAQVVNRQTVEVASGAQAAIYTADMRAQVRQGRFAAGQVCTRAGLWLCGRTVFLQGIWVPVGAACFECLPAGPACLRSSERHPINRRASMPCQPQPQHQPQAQQPLPDFCRCPSPSTQIPTSGRRLGHNKNCAVHTRKSPACRLAGVLHALHRCVRVGGGWAADHQRGPHGWVRLGPEVCVRLHCRRTKAGHAGFWFRSLSAASSWSALLGHHPLFRPVPRCLSA